MKFVISIYVAILASCVAAYMNLENNSNTIIYAHAGNPPNIIEVAQSAGLTTLLAAVQQANLAGPLTDGTVGTVLAPTNAAFNRLGNLLNVLLRDYNVDLLQNIILFHTFQQSWNSEFFLGNAPGSRATLNSQDVSFFIRGNNLWFEGSNEARVNTADVEFSNANRVGFVHVINEVLVPTEGLGFSPDRVSDVIRERAESGENFATFFAALRAVQTQFVYRFLELMREPEGFTVFAPTDEAFDNLPEGTLEFLLNPDNRGDLARVLMYHIVPGIVAPSSRISGGEVLPTECPIQDNIVNNGERATLSIQVSGNSITIQGAENSASVVEPFNVRAENGVIHSIDTVLLPPAIVQTDCTSITNVQECRAQTDCRFLEVFTSPQCRNRVPNGDVDCMKININNRVPKRTRQRCQVVSNLPTQNSSCQFSGRHNLCFTKGTQFNPSFFGFQSRRNQGRL